MIYRGLINPSRFSLFTVKLRRLLKRWEWLFNEKSHQLVQRKRQRRARPIVLPLSPVVDYSKHEPLIRPEQETEYSHQWAAFCAASVEFLCDRYRIPCPDWVNDSFYTLETPWWRTSQPQNPSLRERLLQMTPAPFARRNIFCSNRLFQNKYEIYEWVQEAIEKGITNPGEIHLYARQKEFSIYGA